MKIVVLFLFSIGVWPFSVAFFGLFLTLLEVCDPRSEGKCEAVDEEDAEVPSTANKCNSRTGTTGKNSSEFSPLHQHFVAACLAESVRKLIMAITMGEGVISFYT